VARSLYICYFGLREPLVQTQVIPYLRELVKDKNQISLLTFEPKQSEKEKPDEEMKHELLSFGIDWHCLKYHKRFSVLATAWDVIQGVRFIRRFIARERPDILHGRVHLPTFMAAVARKFSRHKPDILFDIRGFFPEEYTDAGIWPANGLLYRAAKRVERWLLKTSDGFVVLTERARDILFPDSRETGYDKLGRPVEVIPCCVDLSRFAANGDTRTAIREKLCLRDRYVMAYAGAFGGWYLTQEMTSLFAELKKLRPNAFAMILTQSKPEVIEALLKAGGYRDGDYIVTKVSPTDLLAYLSAADAAVSFIKNCYSKQASSPTKNAEYLACGLPIIANAGIGDTDLHLDGTGIGALVRGFSANELRKALAEIDSLGDVRELCRRTAAKLFGLESVGGRRYRRLYARLLEK
jgi:glycosyltransferase involved in cell wall biosynthesis